MHEHLYAQLQPSINTDFVIRCFNGGILPIFFSSWDTQGEEKYHCSEYEDSFLSQPVKDPIPKHRLRA